MRGDKNMEKNQIKICSDPYRKHIYYYWYEENEVWKDMEDMDDSPLNTEHFISAPISHNAYDMFMVFIDKFYNPTVGLRLVFEGTDDDYEDLRSVKEQYFIDYDIELVKGNRKMKSAKMVMPQIEASFSRLKDYFSQYPDSETEEIIMKYSDAVKPEIALCVMGLYSSGKSAFINSIIGQEILPSDSDPATAKIYKISESDKSEIIFTFQGEEYIVEFGENQWRINKNPNSEICKNIKKSIEEKKPRGISQHIYWTLFALNDYAKKEGKERHEYLIKCAERYLNSSELKNAKSDEDKVQKLLKKTRIKELVRKNEIPANKLDDVIYVKVNFANSFLPLDNFKFVIYDTPGSNSVMFREHADILKESLEQQTNGLPIFVTNPDSMDETDNNEIMTIINELGSALDVSNMMLVVNKSDEKSKETLKKKVDNKDNLVVTKWKANRVFFVSSIIGLGGKKDNPDKRESWIDQDYRKVFKKNSGDFSDIEDEDYIRLFDFNILPRDSVERIQKRVEGLPEQELLVWNSGIPCVEEEIGVFAQKYALYNKSSQAIGYLSDATKKLEEVIIYAELDAEESKKKVEISLDDAKKALINEIKDECKKSRKKFTGEYAEAVVNDSVKAYLDENRIKKIIDDAYSTCYGKREIEKVNPFDEKIEASLKADIQSYSKETSTKTENYWKNCAEALRTRLTEIVMGTPNLSTEQKELLKQVVLKVAMVSGTHENLNIKDTEAIKHKGKKFLGFLWDLTRIDKTKAKDKYRESLSKDLSASNKTVATKNEGAFDRWVNELIRKIEEVISSFNPELARLTADLKEKGMILEKKRQEEKFIAQEINLIISLLEFEEVQ